MFSVTKHITSVGGVGVGGGAVVVIVVVVVGGGGKITLSMT